jgi:hypothetical protein
MFSYSNRSACPAQRAASLGAEVARRRRSQRVARHAVWRSIQALLLAPDALCSGMVGPSSRVEVIGLDSRTSWYTLSEPSVPALRPSLLATACRATSCASRAAGARPARWGVARRGPRRGGAAASRAARVASARCFARRARTEDQL